jgi:hypothetical protein
LELKARERLLELAGERAFHFVAERAAGRRAKLT